ncbi:hypothetical protein O6H91_12G073700 [Diphasiastrum complanatum]|uniref:Uncharacterized protein n=1 Tax=Diphasiastrum complanatum TaxID=34168 RepID=A0ACC2C3H0_DIPCM|nr:hypothetical protein O6H91_12G073700 [Diphasiastrum complanatum]
MRPFTSIIVYTVRLLQRLKQRDTGHKKKASRASPVTLRHDNTKSKGLRARGQKEKGWCSLCQVDCNTEEMLGRHLDGKKHKSRVEAETQKKELSKKPENIEANKGEKVTEGDEVGKMLTEEQVEKDGATANLEAKKANKGKVNAKVNTRKKNSKFSKPGSKADASSAEVNDKGVVNETVEKLEKVETEATSDKVEIPVKDLGSEEELQDVEVETIEKVREEKGDEVTKLEQIEELVEANVASKLEEGDAKFQVSEVMEEAAVNTENVAKTLVGDFDMVKDEQEVIASVLILEDKASGTEIVKEVNNGNPETKALSNQNILTGIAAQSQGKKSVLGKRNLEIDGEPPSAKKTRQLKKKGAGTSPSVQTETVRCEVCKVTCRNATVYETHLKGEKHTERLKKVQTPTSKTGKTTKLVDNKVAEEAPNTG